MGGKALTTVQSIRIPWSGINQYSGLESPHHLPLPPEQPNDVLNFSEIQSIPRNNMPNPRIQ